MTDLRQTVALLFKRKGRETLTEKDFVFSASMDLHWFSPREAQRLLDISRERGLLTFEEGRLRPTFNVREVSVPLDFTPSAALLEDSSVDLFEELVTHIAARAEASPKEVVSQVNGLQGRLGIYGEVAALLVGLRLGVDMSGLRERVQRLVEARRATAPAG